MIAFLSWGKKRVRWGKKKIERMIIEEKAACFFINVRDAALQPKLLNWQ